MNRLTCAAMLLALVNSSYAQDDFVLEKQARQFFLNAYSSARDGRMLEANEEKEHIVIDTLQTNHISDNITRLLTHGEGEGEGESDDANDTLQPTPAPPEMFCGSTSSPQCSMEFENAKNNRNLNSVCTRCKTEGGSNPLRSHCSLCCTECPVEAAPTPVPVPEPEPEPTPAIDTQPPTPEPAQFMCGKTASSDCSVEHRNAKNNGNLDGFCNRCQNEGGSNPLRNRCNLCCTECNGQVEPTPVPVMQPEPQPTNDTAPTPVPVFIPEPQLTPAPPNTTSPAPESHTPSTSEFVPPTPVPVAVSETTSTTSKPRQKAVSFSIEMDVGDQRVDELRQNVQFLDSLAEPMMEKLGVERNNVQVTIEERIYRRLSHGANLRRLGTEIKVTYKITVDSDEAEATKSVVESLEVTEVQTALRAKLKEDGFDSIANSVTVKDISVAVVEDVTDSLSSNPSQANATNVVATTEAPKSLGFASLTSDAEVIGCMHLTVMMISVVAMQAL